MCHLCGCEFVAAPGKQRLAVSKMVSMQLASNQAAAKQSASRKRCPLAAANCSSAATERRPNLIEGKTTTRSTQSTQSTHSHNAQSPLSTQSPPLPTAASQPARSQTQTSKRHQRLLFCTSCHRPLTPSLLSCVPWSLPVDFAVPCYLHSVLYHVSAMKQSNNCTAVPTADDYVRNAWRRYQPYESQIKSQMKVERVNKHRSLMPLP